MQRPVVLLFMQGSRRGLWMSVAKSLQRVCDVVLLVKEAGMARIIESTIPGGYKCIEFTEDILAAYTPPAESEAVAAAGRVERMYDTHMSVLMSHTRNLGKGYLYNADRHPDVIASWWPHERKLQEMLKEFHLWETLMDRHKPALVIEESSNAVVSLVSTHRGARHLALGIMKWGNRLFWVETPQYENAELVATVRRTVREWTEADEVPGVDYKQEQATKYLDGLLQYTWGPALRKAWRAFVRETRHQGRRALKALAGRPLPAREGYRYCGWVPAILRRPAMYSYLRRYGRRMKDLEGYRLVYFPLHLEPEVALMRVSQEFNNSMEVVSLVSKALPADTLLVVKENMNALGIRSRHYFDNFRRIGNVVLAHPEMTSWELIRRCDMTVTITGTAAVESVYFDRPVLSYGPHQLVNHLPTVRWASDYASTMTAVRELLDMPRDDRRFAVAKRALYDAQMAVSFDLPGSEMFYVDPSLNMEAARIVVRDLLQRYLPETGRLFEELED